MTGVKDRSLNPTWNETFSLPIVRKKHTKEWTAALAAQGFGSVTETEMSHLLDWDDNSDSNIILSRNITHSGTT
jgi:hypothetical protein